MANLSLPFPPNPFSHQRIDMSQPKRQRKIAREYILHILATPGTNPPPLSANPIHEIDGQGRTVWTYNIPNVTMAFAFLSQQAAIIHQYRWFLYAVNGRGKRTRMRLQLWHRRKENPFQPESMELQLVRWCRRHPDAPQNKLMQLVLEGRRAGQPPNEIDPTKVRSKLHWRYQMLQKQVKDLEVENANLRAELTKVRLTAGTQRNASAMRALVEQYLSARAGMTIGPELHLFAVGLDYNNVQDPHTLLASLAYFHQSGKNAVTQLRLMAGHAKHSSHEATQRLALYIFVPTGKHRLDGEMIYTMEMCSINDHDTLGQYYQIVPPEAKLRNHIAVNTNPSH